jgi:hypothetical protein
MAERYDTAARGDDGKLAARAKRSGEAVRLLPSLPESNPVRCVSTKLCLHYAWESVISKLVHPDSSL